MNNERARSRRLFSAGKKPRANDGEPVERRVLDCHALIVERPRRVNQALKEQAPERVVADWAILIAQATGVAFNDSKWRKASFIGAAVLAGPAALAQSTGQENSGAGVAGQPER